MADKGYVDNLLNALDQAIRYPIRSAIWYHMDNWRLGTGTRATNAQWYRYTSTTSSVALTEFSVSHGLGVVPATLIPVLDLTSTSAQLIPLAVSRAPDVSRVYLKSSSTSARFTFFLEK